MLNSEAIEKRTIVEQLTPPDRVRIFWQLMLFIAASALAVWVGVAYDDELQKYMPESRTLASIFNKRPSGISGLYEIALRVGLECQAWSLPYRQLPDVKGMLVIVAPTDSLAEYETEQILNWVSAGNDLVYLDHLNFQMTRRLSDKLGVKAKDGEELTDQNLPVSESSHPEFTHVHNLRVSAESRVVGGTSLLTDKSGTLFAEIKHGKGRVYLGTVPTLCANRRLADKKDWSNFQFLVNVFRTTHGAIMFDERCHGFSQATNVFVFLAKRTPGLVFMQLIIILLAAVVGSAQRFGRTTQLTGHRKISNLEYINGLASTYRRAKANATVLDILSQSFRTKFCKIAGVSPHESNDKIISQLLSASDREDVQRSVRQLGETLDQVDQALSSKTVPDAQLRELVETCDKITDQLPTLYEVSPASKKDLS
jgi:hypothetical protein